MQRITNIIPSGATPQPTQPVVTIRPLTAAGTISTISGIARPTIQPVARPVIQPVARVTAPVVPPVIQPVARVTGPVIQPVVRPITTPVLSGGRTPIPVQVPRVLPIMPTAQPPSVSLVTPPPNFLVSSIIQQRPVQSVLPITRIQIARPPLSPPTTTGVARFPAATPVMTVRPPLSPFAPTVTSTQLQRGGIPQMFNRIPTMQIPFSRAMPQQITERPLGEWQLDWFARIRQILGQHYGYIDTSQPGAGKTSVALWIAKIFNLPTLVVAPAGIVDARVWRREAQRVNAEHLIIDVLSYNTLAGKKFKQPSHPYLTSIDRITEGGIIQTRFDATDYLKNITGRGCLVIFDEFSNLKNTSRKLKASVEMLASVITDGGSSRYALLSGTPFDKEAHAVNILRALRYIRAPRLYYKDPSTKQVTLEGLQEVIEACRLMDAATTQSILAEDSLDQMTTEMSQSIVYNLYTSVIKQAISGSMTSPPTEGLYEQFNGFFNINANDLVRLKQGINDLANALRFNPNTGAIAATKGAFGKVTPALRIIEFAKINDMIRVVRGYLQRYPRMKAILAVNYTETVDALVAGLADFGPIQFDGRTKKKQRAIIEDTFRDSPYNRVLVGNVTVIGKGLSFQAFDPEDSRLTVVSPSYHMLDISQVAYRTNRAGKKGDAFVYIFYGQGNDIEMETRIVEAMVRKSDVVKGTLDENGNELRLPGEYPYYYEQQT